ncbi:MAG: hypothetical protein KKC55_15505, partial [Gammaproteobacteria bacterium]|nr:hypothetical protein [Gammaproteobacteria bacterium]
MMKQNKIRKCYRFVNKNLTSYQDKSTKWEIKKWNKVKEKLVPCKNGLHASLTPLQSLNNIYGDRWFVAESRGKKIKKKDDKFCASEMRLIKEIPLIVIKRFALFCAKDCLKYYKKRYPDDKRISNCIRDTELYLDDKISLKKLTSAWSAAESAAWSAAKSAAWSAAWSAAKSAAWSAE